MKKYPLTLNYDRKKIIGYIVLSEGFKATIEDIPIRKPLTLGYSGIVKDNKIELNEFSILE